MKLLKILTSTLVVTTLFVGCSTESKNISGENNKKPSVTSDNKDDQSGNKETAPDYDAAGEILEIKDGKIALLSGDIIENYSFPQEVLEKFYVGQSVVIKDKKLMPFIPEKKDSYSIKHNSMGEIITPIAGKVVSISDETLIIESNSEEVTFTSDLDDEARNIIKPGTNVTVGYIQRGDINHAVEIFNDDHTMDLKIKSIKKSDSGEMVITAADDSNVEFIVYVPISTDINFNHSELSPEDSIRVYPVTIMETSPARITPNKIVLNR